MTNSIQKLKRQFRQSIRTRLAAVTLDEYIAWNSSIRQHFFDLPLIKNSRQLMIYYSIKHEVETVSIITTLLSSGKKVVLPVCTPEKNLRACIINGLDELIPGSFGIMEPNLQAKEIEPSELDLVILPGLAFDKRGFRLGQGAGFYDRFLIKATAAFKLGLAYDFQFVPELPVEIHDLPIDAVLTTSGYQEF